MTYKTSIILVAMLPMIGCGPTAADWSPFTPYACGALYAADAQDSTLPDADRAYGQAVVDRITYEISQGDPTAAAQVTAEMMEWRDDYILEAETDWAQSEDGRIEAMVLRQECETFVARTFGMRNTRR